MKKIWAIVFIAFLLTACVFQSLSPVQPIPTATETNVEPSQQGPVKSVQLPQELATETAVAPTSVPMVMVAPTESLQVIYRSARVGLDDSRPYWLTYDTNTWFEEPNPEHPDTEVLMHRFLQGCELRQNYGHGVPSTWAADTSQETIGSTEFEVVAWYIADTGEWVLVSYFWDNMAQQIMIIPGEDPDLCREAALQVITVSEGLGFTAN